MKKGNNNNKMNAEVNAESVQKPEPGSAGEIKSKGNLQLQATPESTLSAQASVDPDEPSSPKKKDNDPTQGKEETSGNDEKQGDDKSHQEKPLEPLNATAIKEILRGGKNSFNDLPYFRREPKRRVYQKQGYQPPKKLTTECLRRVETFYAGARALYGSVVSLAPPTCEMNYNIRWICELYSGLLYGEDGECHWIPQLRVLDPIDVKEVRSGDFVSVTTFKRYSPLMDMPEDFLMIRDLNGKTDYLRRLGISFPIADVVPWYPTYFSVYEAASLVIHSKIHGIDVQSICDRATAQGIRLSLCLSPYFETDTFWPNTPQVVCDGETITCTRDEALDAYRVMYGVHYGYPKEELKEMADQFRLLPPDDRKIVVGMMIEAGLEGLLPADLLGVHRPVSVGASREVLAIGAKHYPERKHALFQELDEDACDEDPSMEGYVIETEGESLFGKRLDQIVAPSLDLSALIPYASFDHFFRLGSEDDPCIHGIIPIEFDSGNILEHGPVSDMPGLSMVVNRLLPACCYAFVGKQIGPLHECFSALLHFIGQMGPSQFGLSWASTDIKTEVSSSFITQAAGKRPVDESTPLGKFASRYEGTHVEEVIVKKGSVYFLRFFMPEKLKGWECWINAFSLQLACIHNIRSVVPFTLKVLCSKKPTSGWLSGLLFPLPYGWASKMWMTPWAKFTAPNSHSLGFPVEYVPVVGRMKLTKKDGQYVIQSGRMITDRYSDLIKCGRSLQKNADSVDQGTSMPDILIWTNRNSDQITEPSRLRSSSALSDFTHRKVINLTVASQAGITAQQELEYCGSIKSTDAASVSTTLTIRDDKTPAPETLFIGALEAGPLDEVMRKLRIRLEKFPVDPDKSNHDDQSPHEKPEKPLIVDDERTLPIKIQKELGEGGSNPRQLFVENFPAIVPVDQDDQNANHQDPADDEHEGDDEGDCNDDEGDQNDDYDDYGWDYDSATLEYEVWNEFQESTACKPNMNRSQWKKYLGRATATEFGQAGVCYEFVNYDENDYAETETPGVYLFTEPILEAPDFSTFPETRTTTIRGDQYPMFSVGHRVVRQKHSDPSLQRCLQAQKKIQAINCQMVQTYGAADSLGPHRDDPRTGVLMLMFIAGDDRQIKIGKKNYSLPFKKWFLVDRSIWDRLGKHSIPSGSASRVSMTLRFVRKLSFRQPPQEEEEKDGKSRSHQSASGGGGDGNQAAPGMVDWSGCRQPDIDRHRLLGGDVTVDELFTGVAKSLRALQERFANDPEFRTDREQAARGWGEEMERPTPAMQSLSEYVSDNQLAVTPRVLRSSECFRIVRQSRLERHLASIPACKQCKFVHLSGTCPQGCIQRMRVRPWRARSRRTRGSNRPGRGRGGFTGPEKVNLSTFE